jgi:hypothetical protein
VASLADLIRQARTAHVHRTVVLDGDYRQAQGWQLPTTASLSAAYEAVIERAEALAHEFGVLAQPVREAVAALAPVVDPAAGLDEVWAGYERAAGALRDVLDLRPHDDVCTVVATPDLLRILVPGSGDLDGAAFLAVIGEVHRRTRAAGHAPTVHQLVAEQATHTLLTGGARTGGPYRTWGTSGFRDHQTYMSVTDPGEGHLDGTLRDVRNLDGVIVHIEHLERGAEQDRSVVEPYRIPHPHAVARIRLALGDDAPSSSYVGRPVFETDAEKGMLKTVHTVAAACSELFSDGLSECKIAIEGVTTTQAIRFMRALSAAVRRDRFTQVLSAAFNLNTPLTDDRRGRPLSRWAGSPRLSAGLVGIEITRAGRFDKVTWDGTADSYPSGCVLEQLAFDEALSLVHLAHSAGLLTYYSAGFRFEHLPRAVYTGVDGVGVGGAQILRYMDKATGHHGPFVPDNIRRILAVRDEAAADPRGRAAALLSRLDRMHYELSLDVGDVARRQRLFGLLRTGEPTPAALGAMLDELRHVEELPPDTAHPLRSWVHRLEQGGARTVFAATVPHCNAVLRRLSAAARRNDLEHLSEQLTALHDGVTGSQVQQDAA